MNNRQRDADERPPRYSDAAHAIAPSYSTVAGPATSTSTPPLFTFHRPKPLSSKVFLRSSNIDKYCISTESSRDAKIWMYAGSSKSNEKLGCLTFPKTHNTFRIYFAAGGDDGEVEKPEMGRVGSWNGDLSIVPLTDAKAGIGFPHPKTFAFKMLRGISSDKSKDFVWVYRSGDMGNDAPVRYDLNADNPEGQLVATLLVSRKDGKGTTVQWHVHPSSELEQAFALLSAVGVITRLTRKGKLYDARGQWGLGSWLAVF